MKRCTTENLTTNLSLTSHITEYIKLIFHLFAKTHKYGDQCWQINAQITAKLLQVYIFNRGEWKSRTNRELKELSKGENIVKWIKGQRISCLGHLERMEEDRMPKKIFTQGLEGTRRRGRPMKGQREEVGRDLQVLGVRRRRELVIDREKWRGIFRQAKAYSGL